MKAAVIHTFNQAFSIDEVPMPIPGADDVIVKVEACGVCHSDLHIAQGDLAGFNAAAKMPLIAGHEVVGHVVQKGDAVTHLAVGARVGVAWLHAACGRCEQCEEGLENLCRNGVITGLMVDGGYAQFMRAKAEYALPVPDSLLSTEAAPLFCAGVTVYRALKNAEVRAGQRVAIFGIGGLGHLAVQIAKAFGAEVIALDKTEGKLALARSLGADYVFNIEDPDAIRSIRKRGGAHVALVTSPAKTTYDAAFKSLRPAGTLAVVGLPPEPLTFAALGLVSGEIRIAGSAVGTRDDLRAVLALAAEGKVRCIIETQPLEQINDVFERMRNGLIHGRAVLTL